MATKKLSAKLSKQNQLTIPNEIINLLSLQEGDTLTFNILDDSSVVIRKSTMHTQGNMTNLEFILPPWMVEESETDYEDAQIN